MSKEEAINLIQYLCHMCGCEIINREGYTVGDMSIEEMIDEYLDNKQEAE